MKKIKLGGGLALDKWQFVDLAQKECRYFVQCAQRKFIQIVQKSLYKVHENKNFCQKQQKSLYTFNKNFCVFLTKIKKCKKIKFCEKCTNIFVKSVQK